jgi:hypothetical protein
MASGGSGTRALVYYIMSPGILHHELGKWFNSRKRWAGGGLQCVWATCTDRVDKSHPHRSVQSAP